MPLARPIGWRRTTLLCAALFSCMIGLWAAALPDRLRLQVVFCMVVMFLLGMVGRRTRFLLGAMAAGLLVGLWRGAAFADKMAPLEQLYGQKIVMTAQAREDATYGRSTQLVFDVDHVHVNWPQNVQIPGRIKVGGFGEKMIYRGDVVRIEGAVRPTLGGRQGQMSFAVLQVVSRRHDPVNGLRQRFASGMQAAMSEPAASFGLGILIGQRSTLPEQTSKQLSIVGLTHLIAVSGYNLTIIVLATRRAMGRASKYQATLLAAALIGGFLLITGYSASIVRAALVSGLTLWAGYYGRQIKPLLLILLAAVITALYNPLYLWGDLGWYLSFLAFYGVLVIAPALKHKWFGEREPKMIIGIMIETIAAHLATAPLIMFVFGQFSVIAIVSNLLVVPLVPLAMLLTAIAGCAGMMVPAVAGWLAWPAQLVLTYMLDVAAMLAAVPYALVRVSVDALGLALLYACIIVISAAVWFKYQPKHAIITDEEASM